jgi:hypothetical protein
LWSGLHVEGAVDDAGGFAVSPFDFVDAFEPRLPALDLAIDLVVAGVAVRIDTVIDPGALAAARAGFFAERGLDATVPPLAALEKVAQYEAGPLAASLTAGNRLRVSLAIDNVGPVRGYGRARRAGVVEHGARRPGAVPRQPGRRGPRHAGGRRRAVGRGDPRGGVARLHAGGARPRRPRPGAAHARALARRGATNRIVTRPRVAIVGGGIAGLGAAHALAGRADVTVFEAAPAVGGHVHTVEVDGTPVDLGFIVFSQPSYPRFTALLDQLGVRSRATPMAFSVAVDDGDDRLEWSSASPRGWFAQRRRLGSPRHWRMLAEVARLLAVGRRDLGSDRTRRVTLDAWLHDRGVAADVRDRFVVPLAAALWSTGARALRRSSRPRRSCGSSTTTACCG